MFGTKLTSFLFAAVLVFSLMVFAAPEQAHAQGLSQCADGWYASEHALCEEFYGHAEAAYWDAYSRSEFDSIDNPTGFCIAAAGYMEGSQFYMAQLSLIMMFLNPLYYFEIQEGFLWYSNHAGSLIYNQCGDFYGYDSQASVWAFF